MVVLLTPLSVISLLIIIVISSILILWEEYDDGILGKLALIALTIAAYVSLDKACSLSTYQCYGTLQQEALLHMAVACWLMRHFYRFLCYYYDGKFSWLRKPPKCE